MTTGYAILAARDRAQRVLGKDDVKTAFAVSRDVDAGLAGILNAVIPGVGTAASGITQLWLDPLQQGITKKPVEKKSVTPIISMPSGGAGGGAGGAGGAGAPGSGGASATADADKKAAAEKAIVDAGAAKVKADANPGDVKLAIEAKVAADKATVAAVDAKMLVPLTKKKSVWSKVAIVGGVIAGAAVLGVVVVKLLGGRA